MAHDIALWVSANSTMQKKQAAHFKSGITGCNVTQTCGIRGGLHVGLVVS